MYCYQFQQVIPIRFDILKSYLLNHGQDLQVKVFQFFVFRGLLLIYQLLILNQNSLFYTN